MADAVPLHRLVSDPIAMRFMPRGPSASLEETEERLAAMMRLEADAGTTLYVAEERASGAVCGVAGVFPYALQGPDLELGFAFMRTWWGRGLASEIATALVAWALGETGLAREAVWAVAYEGHDVSRRVLERAGLRPWGRVRHRGRAGLLLGCDGWGSCPAAAPRAAQPLGDDERGP